MKKTLLNIGLTIALSGAAMSGSVLSTQAYAADLNDSDTSNVDSSNIDNDKPESSDNYLLPGMGAGAAAGTLVAGPVGFIVGGLIGGFVGSSQETDDSDTQITVVNKTMANETVSGEDKPSIDNALAQSDPEIDNNSDNNSLAEDNTALASVQVAQLGHISVPEANNTQHDEIVDIITADLSLDIYFRSGSTDVEAFYPARLDAVANLMGSMNQLEIHLDGYTDRRGNKEQNIKLANQRIENVRQQLITAGVVENRIISKAYGEMKMVSQPGDLEAYTFDRKVVIRFKRSNADSMHTMTSTLSALDSEDTASTSGDEVEQPIVVNASIAF